MNEPNAAWITSQTAAQLLSELNGRTVTPNYIYVLARRQRIRTKPLIGRVRLYNRADCARYRLRELKMTK